MGNANGSQHNIDHIFNTNRTQSLCCFVTKDFTLTGVIQQEFKSRYGSIEWLKSQNKTIGDIIAIFSGNRYIYYLIIKESNYRHTNIEHLNTALNNLIIHAQNNGVTNIGFPEDIYPDISLDQLKTSIVTAFNGTNIQYSIYNLGNIYNF